MLLAAVCLSLALSHGALAEPGEPPAQTVITNVHVFDGVAVDRIENASVLVEGNRIRRVSWRDLHEHARSRRGQPVRVVLCLALVLGACRPPSAEGSVKILILDYTREKIESDLIASWLPEDAQVTSIHITSADQFTDELLNAGHTHVIHSGSEMMLPELPPQAREKAKAYVNALVDAGVPQFGICFGHQLLSATLMGVDTVRTSPNGHELGWREMEFSEDAQRIFGLGARERFFQLHRDEVTAVPQGALLLATNGHSAVQGFIHEDYKMLGTQFHPEMDRTHGNEIFMEYHELFEKNGLDLDAVLAQGPSEGASRKLFETFLAW